MLVIVTTVAVLSAAAVAAVQLLSGIALRRSLRQGAPGTLVAVDSEVTGILDQAAGWMKNKDYETAVEVLQLLIEMSNTGFVPTQEAHRYVAAAGEARRLLGSMDAEGLAVYRRRYDAPARRLYEQGALRWDEAALRRVARRYLHTSSGPPALEMLGAIHFDRGRFARAASCWRRAAGVGQPGRVPVLLAKQAVALHLAGQTEAAGAAAEQLSKRFGKAVAVLGGRKWNLVEFVASKRRLPPPEPRPPTRSKTKWYGPTGSADGGGVMDDCGVVTASHWRAPKDVSPPGVDVRGAMIALDHWLTHHSRPGHASPVYLADGHVQVLQTRSRRRGKRAGGGRSLLPPTIHPIVVDNVVIYRDDERLVAYELGPLAQGSARAGRLAWRSAPLPIYPVRAPSYHSAHSALPPVVPDPGRHAVSTDGHRVYLLAGRHPPPTSPTPPVPRPVSAGPIRSPMDLYATRVLAAVSVRHRGRTAWSIGCGTGDDDVIRRGRFLSTPTVHNGRLYAAVALYNALYLVRLAAETGKLIWKADICDLPPGLDRIAKADPYTWPLGVSIGVADGRVFVSTNVGVIAGFDADSGSPAWAVQCKSPTHGRRASAGHTGSGVNPVIVTAGRVICLLADTRELIALSPEDGRVLWRLAGGQADLSAVDADRVLISSPGLTVVDARTGKPIHRRADVGVVGRPAVGTGAVLASGRGKLLRLDLRSYALVDEPLSAGGAILGNLVAVDGVLLAANTTGVQVYLNYQAYRTRLTALLGRRAGPRRTELLVERGKLACNAGQYAAALIDLVPAAKRAADAGATHLAGEARSLLIRTHVARGNRATSPDRMQDHFELAAATAVDARDRARMLVRLAKCHELQARQLKAATDEASTARKLKALVSAIQTARKLAASYAGQDVPDLKIGPEAVRAGTDRSGASSFSARNWATGVFIPKLLADYGRECYAALDARAEAALQQALDAGKVQAILAVAKRWPNSLHMPRALLEAGKVVYRQATAADRPDTGLLARATELLSSAAARTSDPRLAVRALAGMAVIQHRRNSPIRAMLICRRIRRRCRTARIDLTEPLGFDRTHPTLGSVLNAFGSGFTSPRPHASVGSIDAPLEPAFTISGTDVYVVQNSAYRAVRRGGKVLLAKGARLFWVNVAADNAKKSVLWTADLPVRPSSPTGWVYMATEWIVGAVSTDGKVIAVGASGRVVLLDAATGRPRLCQVALPHGVNMLGFGPDALIVADLRANIACVDPATGKTRWKTKTVVAGYSTAPQIRDNMVLMHGNVWRGVACLDLATGKVLAHWKGGTDVRGMLLGEGLVAVMADGKLALYDGPATNEPIWRHSYNNSAQPALLSACDEKLFVSEGVASPWIDVIALDGERLGRFAIQVSARSVVGWVRPDGRYLYVGVGDRLEGPRAYRHAGITQMYSRNVQKIDMITGKVLWSRSIHSGKCLVAVPGTVAGPTLVVTAKMNTFHYPESVYLLNTADGSLQTLHTFGKQGRYDQPAIIRRYVVGPSTVIAGRLCADTQTGVTVYRPKAKSPARSPTGAAQIP